MSNNFIDSIILKLDPVVLEKVVLAVVCLLVVTIVAANIKIWFEERKER